MTQQRGVSTKILLGFENVAYGTPATVGFVLPLNSCGIVGTKARNSPATLTGTRNTVAPFAGNQNVAGPIVIPLDSGAMPYWLTAMFGDPTTSGSYVHEFKVPAVTVLMPSFTLEEAFADIAAPVYQRFVGCKVQSLSMTFGGDGELTGEITVLGSKMTHETSAFDAAPTPVTLARVENFSAAILEGGSPLANATELSINLDFGLDPNSFVIGGGGIRGDIPAGLVTVTGNLKTLFEDKTLLVKATGDTESSLKVTVTASATSVLEFEIQELLYSVNGVPVEGPQGLIVSLDFVGYYADGGEASNIVARVTNDVVSYDLIT